MIDIQKVTGWLLCSKSDFSEKPRQVSQIWLEKGPLSLKFLISVQNGTMSRARRNFKESALKYFMMLVSGSQLIEHENLEFSLSALPTQLFKLQKLSHRSSLNKHCDKIRNFL